MELFSFSQIIQPINSFTTQCTLLPLLPCPQRHQHHHHHHIVTPINARATLIPLPSQCASHLMMTLATTSMHLSAATVAGADLTRLAVPSAEHTRNDYVLFFTIFIPFCSPLFSSSIITLHVVIQLSIASVLSHCINIHLHPVHKST